MGAHNSLTNYNFIRQLRKYKDLGNIKLDFNDISQERERKLLLAIWFKKTAENNADFIKKRITITSYNTNTITKIKLK